MHYLILFAGVDIYSERFSSSYHIQIYSAKDLACVDKEFAGMPNRFTTKENDITNLIVRKAEENGLQKWDEYRSIQFLLSFITNGGNNARIAGRNTTNRDLCKEINRQLSVLRYTERVIPERIFNPLSYATVLPSDYSLKPKSNLLERIVSYK